MSSKIASASISTFPHSLEVCSVRVSCRRFVLGTSLEGYTKFANTQQINKFGGIHFERPILNYFEVYLLCILAGNLIFRWANAVILADIVVIKYFTTSFAFQIFRCKFSDWIGGMCYADALQVWFPAYWASGHLSTPRRMSTELSIPYRWIKLTSMIFVSNGMRLRPIERWSSRWVT